jgi:3-methyladenine DNA glycosylase AlkC
MAEALKHFFDERLIRSIGASFQELVPGWKTRRFVKECLDGLDELELIARGRRVAEVMRRHLPEDFDEAAEVIVGSLGPESDGSGSVGMAPFRYLPHVFFVGTYGLGHFEASMRAQHELTRRFTAEWSIRGFLVEHREATLARLRVWARDPSVHVRRLVSEGTRPRLPWAPRLRAFQEDPAPVIELLELLKDDGESYVQRSVANNVNDIAKDHPDVAVALCRRWQTGATAGRRWIVGHALRSLIKGGDRGALATMGFAGAPKVAIEAAEVPKVVRLGATLRFSFDVVSRSRQAQELLVDYAVHFVKANGETRPKVFKLRKLALRPGERVRLDARVSFAALTTRTHRPGRHVIEAVINGVTFPLGAVMAR